MVNDAIWRKMPRDILSNANLQWVESQVAPEYSAAPYMFYITALTLADNDGIFDLEDGIIFSRLMRIGNVKLVKQIANLMQRRRLIVRPSAESNLCYLTDWDYSPNKKSLSADERRQRVQSKINEAKKKNSQKQFSDTDFEEPEIKPYDIQEGDAPEQPITVNFQNKPNSDVFLCPENDKKCKSVASERVNDKNAKNVDTTERKKERKKERKITEERKDTHTQAADFRGLRGPLQSLPETTAVADKEKKDSAEKERDDERIISDDEMFAECYPEIGSQNDSDEEKDADPVNNVLTVINDFFVKNCYGYKPNQGKRAIEQIAQRCRALSNEKNPPDIIASVFLKEFKKLHDAPGYYNNVPILPAFVLKPGVWAHLLQNAGKILLTNENSRKQWDAMAEQYYVEAEKEKAAICDELDKQYVKYGIDPQDPNRVFLLQMAKKQEAERKG